MVAGGGSAATGSPVALFCDRLRRLQKASGLTQKRLTEVSERGRTQVSDILNGNIAEPPNWTVVEKIVDACLAHADQERRLVPPDLRDREDWRRRYFDLEQDVDARGRPGKKAPPPDRASQQSGYSHSQAEVIPAVQRLEAWVVDRPAEVDQVVAALLRGGTVALTTALHGAGGFGKTTVAKMVRCDQRVLDEFGNRVYWVTVGRDTGTESLAGLVNGLIGWIQPGRAGTFPDVRQAADYLAALLAEGPRRLLVVDDVWSETQLAAFPVAGQCARLVTTRFPLLVDGSEAVRVPVDQMSVTQAHALLSAGLPLLPPVVVEALLQETGRWPLLLRLVNKILIDQARFQPVVSRVAEDLLRRLRSGGALQVDELTGAAAQRLDVSDPDQRSKALGATIQASVGLLSDRDRDRLAELAVFAEDETIPVTLIAALWHETGRLDELAARALCARLSDLALIDPVQGDDGVAVTMHDVIREYLSEELGPQRLAQTHQALLSAAAADLPTAAPAGMGSGHGTVTAWWELPQRARYLRDHLIEHLTDADRGAEAEAVASDLRWVAVRLQSSGPGAPSADLARAGTPRAALLKVVLDRMAHLLAPTEPAESLIDILYSRATADPYWAAQATALQANDHRPRLTVRWPLPGASDPSLLHVISIPRKRVEAMALAPDGSWLAVAGINGKIHIVDAATGRTRAILDGPVMWCAITIAPDGSWLTALGGFDPPKVRAWDTATWQERPAPVGPRGPAFAVDFNSYDGSVRIWEALTGNLVTTFTQLELHEGPEGLAVAPDGTWLATGNWGAVRIWDAGTKELRATLTGHKGGVYAVTIAPDSSWLASGGSDQTVRIWDAVTKEPRATYFTQSGPVHAIAIAPDGTRLAAAGDDGTVRIWDAAAKPRQTARESRSLAVDSLAVAPDSSWLATGSFDITNGRISTTRLWDLETGQDSSRLAASDSSVTQNLWDQPARIVSAAAVAPDGSWLAVTHWHDGNPLNGALRIKDGVTGQQRAALPGSSGEPIEAAAVAPDGSWLATVSDRAVQIWDTATWQNRTTIATDWNSSRSTIAVAPDGNWLVTGEGEGVVRIWGTASWKERAILTSGTLTVNSVAIAPDGKWMATGGDDWTVRVWDTSIWKVAALMRVDGAINALTWLDGGELVIGGPGGLYLFDFKIALPDFPFKASAGAI